MVRVVRRIELPVAFKRFVELALAGGHAVEDGGGYQWILWDGDSTYYRVSINSYGIAVEEIEPDCRVRALFEGNTPCREEK